MSVSPQAEKEAVRAYWDEAPCGTRDLDVSAGERAMFAELERTRDEREPFIGRFARFAEARGQRVLEVGVGAGTDFVRFARAGARAWGVDFTAASTAMARKRLAAEQLEAGLFRADAEALPFETGAFDLVYSWGVIHHTPDTPRAAREIVRVLKPGGRACVMVYHRWSLLAAQAWLRWGLLGLRPLRPISEILAAHVESPGTRAYTLREAAALFPGLDAVTVTPVVTPYDLRLGRRLFLPAPLRALVPARLGWFLVVEGRKPR